MPLLISLSLVPSELTPVYKWRRVERRAYRPRVSKADSPKGLASDGFLSHKKMDDLTILQATQQLEYSFLITKKSSRISGAQFGTRWIMGLPLYPHPLNMPNFFLI